MGCPSTRCAHSGHAPEWLAMSSLRMACHERACGSPIGESQEIRMAGSTGLEPAASAVTGQRSSQLNYDPKLRLGGTGFEPVTAGV